MNDPRKSREATRGGVTAGDVSAVQGPNKWTRPVSVTPGIFIQGCHRD
jgi:hypothetical protein